VLLALLPVGPLILAVLFHPQRTNGFPALLGGVLVYYIVFFSLFAYGPLGAPTVIQHKSFQSSNISEAQVELSLSTFNGQITLLPSDSNVVVINATVKTLSGSSNSVQLGFNDSVRNAKHIVSLNAQQTISSWLPFFSPDLSVTLQAYTPRNHTYTVDASTSNGTITVTSLNGPALVARTSNGAITLKDLNFNSVDAKTSNGHIGATVGGQTVTLTTSNGGVDLEALGPGAYTVNTSNGGIQVSLNTSLPVKVQASTSNGGITWNGPALTTSSSGRDSLTGQTPGFDPSIPHIELHLTTSNGGIGMISA
jgi:hypothetical protein